MSHVGAAGAMLGVGVVTFVVSGSLAIGLQLTSGESAKPAEKPPAANTADAPAAVKSVRPVPAAPPPVVEWRRHRRHPRSFRRHPKSRRTGARRRPAGARSPGTRPARADRTGPFPRSVRPRPAGAPAPPPGVTDPAPGLVPAQVTPVPEESREFCDGSRTSCPASATRRTGHRLSTWCHRRIRCCSRRLGCAPAATAWIMTPCGCCYAS